MAGSRNSGSNSSSIIAYSLEGGGKQTETQTETDRERETARAGGGGGGGETQDAKVYLIGLWPSQRLK